LSAFTTGILTATVIKAGEVADAQAFATGAPKPLILTVGSSTAQAMVSGVLTPIFALVGNTATTNAFATGIARAFSFAISGYTRNAAGTLLGGVRVDIYRKSDHAHMGRVTSDPTAAYYSLAIPNTAQVFWCRFYLIGPPDRFDTTIDDLVLVESQTQGPPP